MTKKSVDLASIFGAVAESLAENQEALNQADRYNQDHGTNMLQTFETIANALEKKQDSSDSVALAYAAKQVAKKADSGSSRLYAEHLNQASSQFKRRKVDEKGAFELLQTLIGGAQPPTVDTQPVGDDLLGALMGGMAGGGSTSLESSTPDAGDLLGALMGGMAGSGSSQNSSAPDTGDLLGALMGGMSGGSQSQSPSSPSVGDLLGTLMGGMSGSSGSSSQQQGLNLQNLLAAGMAYMQAKQSGKDTLQALIQAFVAGSNMGKDPYRTQSTELVVQSFLQALSSQAR